MMLTHYISRLVAEYFIPNDDPENKIAVRHKDGDIRNNIISNLEWIPISEKMDVVKKNGVLKGPSKYNDIDIHKVCKLLVDKRDFDDIYKITGVRPNVIYSIAMGTRWKRISSQYDLSFYHDRVLKDKQDKINTIHKACIYIEENRPFKYIKDTLGLTSSQVSKLLLKKSYTDISDNYDFSNYNYGFSNDYIDRLHAACKYAESGEYSVKDISEIVGISYKKVKNMLSGKTWCNISKNYNLSKYRKS